MKISKILTQNETFEAAHSALAIPEILLLVAECLAERDIDWEEDNLRNAAQVNRSFSAAFKPVLYRDIYLGPSALKGPDADRRCRRLLDLLRAGDTARYIRTLRVAFTRQTTRARSSAQDKGPEPVHVAEVLTLATGITSLFLSYIDPEQLQLVLLPALLALDSLKHVILSHNMRNLTHEENLDYYAAFFQANPQIHTLNLRAVASIAACSDRSPSPENTFRHLAALNLRRLTLRDFLLTRAELTVLFSNQTRLETLLLSRPAPGIPDPMSAIVQGISSHKSSLKTLAIDGFPVHSAFQLVSIHLDNLQSLHIEEQKLDRGKVIDALPSSLQYCALYRTDFGATHTSAFVNNLKKFLSRPDVKLEEFKVPKWTCQNSTQRTTLWKLGKKHGVKMSLE